MECLQKFDLKNEPGMGSVESSLTFLLFQFDALKTFPALSSGEQLYSPKVSDIYFAPFTSYASSKSQWFSLHSKTNLSGPISLLRLCTYIFKISDFICIYNSSTSIYGKPKYILK